MTIVCKPEHEVVYQELTALISKHADKMTALEILAVAANMVGKLVALQDQRTVTRDIAFEVIMKNLELGNQQAIGSLRDGAPAGRA